MSRSKGLDKGAVASYIAALLAGCIVLGMTVGAACEAPPSGIYGPCETSKNCDMKQTDVCVLRGGGWCTVLCSKDSDCPAKEGEPASCVPMGKLRICEP